MAKAMLHTKAEVVGGVKAEEGILEAVVGSSNVLDRIGDVIDQAGWQLRNFVKTNPVILWGHNQKEERPPIGKALKVWIQDKGEKTAKLMFKVQFDLQDNFAKEIFRKVRDGFINTVSVGFLPIEWEQLDEDDIMSGRKYTKQELLELSFVPVPANPEAVVALRGMEDKRFTPIKIEELYPPKKKVRKLKEIKDEAVEKPMPNNHACRLRDPGDFKEGSFRTTSRKHKGKKYQIVMGRLKGETTMTEQAYRYGKDVWGKAEARSHCKSHDGTFEPAEGTSLDKPEVRKPVIEKPEKEADEKEGVREEKPKQEKGKEVKKEEPKKEPVKESKEEKPAAEAKGVIPYGDHGTVPESAPWDGPGEVRRAEVSDLKVMCAWFDSAEPDIKTSYKLPHHKADGHKCVWRGTAAAMAALLGARGGTQIPEGNRRGVFNHLKKHYGQFDKEAPDFKSVEGQVLKGFEEEIHSLILDREDRYVVRLIKKVLEKINKKKEIKAPGYTIGQTKDALRVLDSALSLLEEARRKGVKNEG